MSSWCNPAKLQSTDHAQRSVLVSDPDGRHHSQLITRILYKFTIIIIIISLIRTNTAWTIKYMTEHTITQKDTKRQITQTKLIQKNKTRIKPKTVLIIRATLERTTLRDYTVPKKRNSVCVWDMWRTRKYRKYFKSIRQVEAQCMLERNIISKCCNCFTQISEKSNRLRIKTTLC